ncbi:MAG: acyltransferase [Lachnospiraceae bacterium]|nr:acyltransferase [Lachnospiraceae bacterium]
MRRHYIDNLRNLTILLLFPVHTFMIWNNFGSKFYIWQGENKLLSTFIVFVNPWFMPLLFVLAGMSARYSLKKRSNKEYIIQRIHKLLIPFICNLVVLVPFQSLFARKFFYSYNGGLPEHWKYFFTHLTDFSGYDGAFTPGQLWFILFLFIISMFSLIPFRFIPYQKVAKKAESLPLLAVLLLFLPIWLMYHLGNFGGFSLGKNLALFLLGYYLLSNDTVIERIEKNIKQLTILWIVTSVTSVVLYYHFSYYGDLWINFVGWISILVLLIWGKKGLNRQTCFTEYFNDASYPIYILHQSILVALAYYVVQICDILFVQVFCICVGSFILTVLAYHFIKCIPVVREMIGCMSIKSRK